MTRRKIKFEDHPQLPFDDWFVENGNSSLNELKNSYNKEKEEDYVRRTAPLPADTVSELTGDEPAAAPDDPSRHLHYISFGSGSSGNSCYIGCSRGGIIIDAGIPSENIAAELARNGVGMEMVKGLLLTHDHSDHVRYAYNLLRKNRHMRLFCTNRVLNGLLRRHSISKRIKEYHNPIFKEIPFRILDFEITAFEVPHDGTDNMGFSIEFADKRFVLATDLGAVHERAYYYMSRANYLVIEANYDLGMLLNGRYPEYLKARIQTDNGHMQNEATAIFLRDIVNPGLKYVFLCHLSQDNNTPAFALRAVRDTLEKAGLKVGEARHSIEDRKADIQLMALPRFEATRWFVFR